MRNIAIIAGGYTSEREISLNSGEQILKNIDTNLYNPYLIDVRKNGFFCIVGTDEIKVDINDFSISYKDNKINFHYAYITLHGSPGEDGKVQALLDLINIPYSASGIIPSVVSFDKMLCKKALANSDVVLAKSVNIKGDEDFSVNKICDYVGLPCFVKPNTAGSSYGVSKVYKKEDFVKAVKLAQEQDNNIIVEEFIDGIEVSCGILKIKDKVYKLPVTEIVTKNDYFDTNAKYDSSLTDEITPARISNTQTVKIQKYCERIYKLLNCKGIVRIDFIIKNETPYFLELNSMPGMSAESIIPKQLKNMKVELKEILSEIIEDSFYTD